MSRSHRRALLFREPILVGADAATLLHYTGAHLSWDPSQYRYVVRLWLVTGPISGVRP